MTFSVAAVTQFTLSVGFRQFSRKKLRSLFQFRFFWWMVNLPSREVPGTLTAAAPGWSPDGPHRVKRVTASLSDKTKAAWRMFDKCSLATLVSSNWSHVHCMQMIAVIEQWQQSFSAVNKPSTLACSFYFHFYEYEKYEINMKKKNFISCTR